MKSEITIPCEKCKNGSVRLYIDKDMIYTKCDICGYVETLPTINSTNSLYSLKQDLEKLLDEQITLSQKLCPDEESDSDDGEEIFDEGRGQGIYETCIRIREFLKEY